MTYQQYGTITALDYNTFSTNVNAIFKDSNLGATTYGTASLGYGQTLPSLSTTVPVGSTVLASQWADLFTAIKKCGNHQGTPVVPPLPGAAPGYGAGSTTLPSIGQPIVAYNTPAGALTTLITTLGTNRFNLYPGESAIVDPTTYSAPGWTNSLTYTFTANFGSWNSARYFFNTGGAIRISGAHPNTGGSNTEWNGMLLGMSPLVFNYGATTPLSGTPGPIGGFWNTSSGAPLTSAFQTIYTQTYVTAPYSGSYIRVNAKLGAAAGAAGSEIITFEVYFFQADSGTLGSSKTGTTLTPGYRYSPTGTSISTNAPVITSLGFTAT